MGGIFSVAPRDHQSREQFHHAHRLQSTQFGIAARIVKDFHQDANRHQLFPQVLRLVGEYVTTRVEKSDEADLEDIALTKYQTEIAERIRTALRPVTSTGDPPILPVLDTYRPTGTTADVVFTTARNTWRTTKSHVSHVVLESTWERRAAQILESHPNVICYVRNYKLDFTIPYRFGDTNHQYTPDFIVVMSKDPLDPESRRLNLILEIKGEEDERDRAKEAGANRWRDAVNYAGKFGAWWNHVCRNVDSLRSSIDWVVRTQLEPAAEPQ